MKFGPAYSPWSNRINERNHASGDLTIKKWMEEKKTPLSDMLVKAAAWTHNTSVNKLGYSPLQLVTGKEVSLPGLTTGNVALESMTDSEAVQRTIENLTRTVSEFREADMRKKLKECQDYRIQAYQHQRNYVEGDKVWYQPLSGNTWFGPAAVLCQRGNTVWLHSQGDIKKVAASRVKPYKLVDEVDDKKEESSNDLKTFKSCDQGLAPGMKSSHKENVGSCGGSPKDERLKKHVMLEDGLQDVDALHAELEKDLTGARYLRRDNSVCFSDFCTFVIELPVSEHWRPEVIAAKEKEIENLMD